MPVVRTIVSLGPRRWPGMAYLAALGLAVEIALRTVPLPRLARSLGAELALSGTAAPTGSIDEVDLTRREADLLDTAWRIMKRRPFNPTCLRQALIGGHILRRRSPQVRIGVTKIAGAVSAHAWVEVEGISLDPDGTTRFAADWVPLRKD